jgi:hypothetical protein
MKTGHRINQTPDVAAVRAQRPEAEPAMWLLGVHVGRHWYPARGQPCMPSYAYRVFGFLELELGLAALVQKDIRSLAPQERS